MEKIMRAEKLCFAGSLVFGLSVAVLACGGTQQVSRSGSNPALEGDSTDQVVAEAPPCLDRDQDGVCDADDHCLTESGPPQTLGCPANPCGAPLLVEIRFADDSSELRPPQADNPGTVDPVLDAVVEGLMQDSACRICIVGHASEEGQSEYNLNLSRRRASGVPGYLIARGLPVARIPSTGLGERCQIVPETTRSANRLVEFRRLEEGESCPVTCSN